MTDKQIANKLIKWVAKIKLWTIKDEQESLRLAKEHLAEIKAKYGWKAMKQTFLHGRDCTTLTKFEHSCRAHKKELEKKGIYH